MINTILYQRQQLLQEQTDFYIPAFEGLAPSLIMEMLRVIFRNVLIRNDSMFSKHQIRENKEAFLTIIGVMDANKPRRDQLINSYLASSDEWVDFQNSFPEKLIVELPHPKSSLFLKTVEVATAKYGKTFSRLIKKKKSSNQKRHKNSSSRLGVDKTPEEFQEQASLWLEGIERSSILRNRTITKDLNIQQISGPKIQLENPASNAVPHPEYKQTLESSFAQSKDQSLQKLFETYEFKKSSANNKVGRKVEVEVRTQQGNFRKEVFALYKSTCCVSGYAVEAALHAAHIVDYSVTRDNSPQNGLCLRADIHILFDKGLIKIDPNYLIEVSDELEETQYWQYNGNKISLPQAQIDWPRKSNLKSKCEKI